MTQMTIFDIMNVKEPEPGFSPDTKMLLEIFRGENKHIDRATLRDLVQSFTGRYIADRTMRKMIETARQEGLVICNEQNGEGYFLPTTRAELLKQYEQNESRAKSILRQQRFIRMEMAKWT